MRPSKRLVLSAVLMLVAVVSVSAIVAVRSFLSDLSDPRTVAYAKWKAGDRKVRASLTTPVRGRCPDSPFLLPSTGFIALMYADPRPPYSRSHPHQGIDIFSSEGPGLVPVYAAHDGFVTRKDHWKSAVIIRVPDDPLRPGKQVWLYYAHMANDDGSESYIVEELPPGTVDRPVAQGDLLGHTGNYRGDSGYGVAVHLHFSIVEDDGSGNYANELDIANTLDPSPYFGMKLHHDCAPIVPRCSNMPLCSG